jgi:hypothetical protein
LEICKPFYVPAQLGRFTPLVVQWAFGLWSPESPLQSPVPGHTLCLGLAAKTLLASVGAIASAAVAMIIIAKIIFVCMLLYNFIIIKRYEGIFYINVLKYATTYIFIKKRYLKYYFT